MEIIKKLKKESTILTIVFNVLTMGAYGAFYMKEQTEKLNELLPENEKISHTTSTAAMVVAIVSAAFGFLSLFVDLSESLTQFDNLITLTAAIFMLVWTFTWRNRFYTITGINSHHPYKLHGFWLFIFGVYYVNYKINVIHDSTVMQEQTQITM